MTLRTIENNRPTFIDTVLAGEAKPDEIDDFIDEWHSGGAEQPLWAALGMTRDEYAAWAVKPALLAEIIDRRR